MASSPSSCSHKYLIITLLFAFSMHLQNVWICNASQTFDFEIHHRSSDQVKAIIAVDNLPEIGSREDGVSMAHREKVSHGRSLADNDGSKLLTLSNGETSQINSFSYLHYANVSLGTPSLSFLVALDTGTNLLWVPCDCTTCSRNATTSTRGAETKLNIYSSNSSSTSKDVSCKSNLCFRQNECSESSRDQCPYQIVYNQDTTSTGILVEDILHLETDNRKPKDIDARITFGCGQVQTGFYLNRTATNGLFGLGIGKTSVPSILSRKGLVADSFSMCFGFDAYGIGRISFGDKGSSDQDETPLNLMQLDPSYNISVTQLSVGGNLSDLLDVTAIFYSGAEVTYLSDPAYTALSENFHSQTLYKRSSDPKNPYEYCYEVSSSSDSTEARIPNGPNVTLIMKGGSKFNVYNPMLPIPNNASVYCLGVLKISNGNFIGHNFMTGHHIVFDREKMVLGWKSSNCTDPRNDEIAQIPAVSPASPPTINVQPPSSNDG